MAETGGSVQWILDVDDSKFSTGLKKAKSEAQAFGSSVDKIDFKGFSSNASSAFGSIANGIQNVATKLALATVGSGALGTVFLKSAADLQVTNRSFDVLIGNASVANKIFADIKKFADQTPFEFPELAKSAKTLLGYGVSSDVVLDRLKRLGDAAAASGGDLGGITLAYAQMIGRGKVTGDNLRQLTENMVTLRSELSQVSGVPILDLDKAIENSEISTEELNAALDLATNKGGKFFDATSSLALTFNGRISTLKDTFLEFGRSLLGVKVDPELGLTIQPGGVFDRLSLLIPVITQNLTKLAPKIKSGFDFIIANGDTVKAIVAGIAAAFVGAKIAAVAFAIAAAINPVGLIATAIVALIGVFTFLQVRFDIFGKALAALQPIINPIVNIFKEMFKILGEQLAPIISFVMDHLDVFKKIALALLVVGLVPIAVIIGSIIIAFGLLVGAVTLGIAVFNKIVSVAQSVASNISSVISTIVSSVSNLSGTLYNAGRNLIQGLLDGAGSLLSKMGQFFLDKVPSFIREPFKKALGISSPSKLFAGYGVNIAQGLVQGIGQGEAMINSAVSGLSGATIEPVITPSMSDIGMRAERSSSTAVSNVTVNMDGIMARSRSDLRDVAKDLVESINEELRAKRKPQIGAGAI